jgi:hypothetical protein
MKETMFDFMLEKAGKEPLRLAIWLIIQNPHRKDSRTDIQSLPVKISRHRRKHQLGRII